MNTRARTFNVYSDPSHGWIKAPIKLLKELGIEDQITTYSYMRGDFAYLEEDQDATTFLMELDKLNIPYKIKESTSDKSSRIRNYSRFVVLSEADKKRYNEIRRVLLDKFKYNTKGTRHVKNGSNDDLNYWNKYYNLNL
jgi:hypothetical protein